MKSLSETEVLAILNSDGTDLDSFYFLSSSPTGVFVWNASNGPMHLRIEDTQHANECRAFLQSLGARTFSSHEEVVKTAVAEKWDGWERFKNFRQ